MWRLVAAVVVCAKVCGIRSSESRQPGFESHLTQKIFSIEINFLIGRHLSADNGKPQRVNCLKNNAM